MEIDISICLFQNGTFDVIFRDRSTHDEITLSGSHKLTDEQKEFAYRVAPACVYTKYLRLTPED